MTEDNTPATTSVSSGNAANLDSTANLLAPDDHAKLRALVVDTGALVRGEKLEELAEEFFTIREVLAEVRDKRTRRMLETLPFRLQVKEPSEEALKRVVDFAKQTGDLNVLSKPDIKVMALAYMLHVQHHGSDSLRKAPQKPAAGRPAEKLASSRAAPVILPASNGAATRGSNVSSADQRRVQPGVSWAGVVGAVSSSGEEVKTAEALETKSVALEESPWDDDDFVSLEQSVGGPRGSQVAKNLASAQKEEKESLKAGDTVEEWPELPAAGETLEEQLPENVVKRRESRLKEREEEEEAARVAREEEIAKTAERIAALTAGAKQEASPQTNGSRILGNSEVYVDSGIGVGDYDDGVGWIDSSNIEDALAFSSWTSVGKKGSENAQKKPVEEEKPCVGCITTDYAMQNVLLQMKLHLISVEGRRVTSVRRFVLKCDACYKLCLQLDKVFCPSCGNNTLARLSYSIDSSGVMRYHYKKNRRINLRGSKYSIPTKKPGDKQPQLLLREDQLLTGWWGQQARKKDKSDSMFGEHVAESFGLSLSRPGNSIQVGFGRNNVNAKKGRERRGKKKSRSKKK